MALICLCLAASFSGSSCLPSFMQTSSSCLTRFTVWSLFSFNNKFLDKLAFGVAGVRQLLLAAASFGTVFFFAAAALGLFFFKSGSFSSFLAFFFGEVFGKSLESLFRPRAAGVALALLTSTSSKHHSSSSSLKKSSTPLLPNSRSFQKFVFALLDRGGNTCLGLSNCIRVMDPYKFLSCLQYIDVKVVFRLNRSLQIFFHTVSLMHNHGQKNNGKPGLRVLHMYCCIRSHIYDNQNSSIGSSPCHTRRSLRMMHFHPGQHEA